MQPDDNYTECPEAIVVALARSGDERAFAELVARHQSPVRHLMRRFSGDPALADDLAQQVFLQVWLKISSLKETKAFGGWLKRIAVTVWLQQRRKKDALRGAEEYTDEDRQQRQSPGMSMDLDRALAALPETVRMCVVLSYQEGMSHPEIAEVTDLPLGTVKSHINRGARRLQEMLGAYRSTTKAGES